MKLHLPLRLRSALLASVIFPAFTLYAYADDSTPETSGDGQTENGDTTTPDQDNEEEEDPAEPEEPQEREHNRSGNIKITWDNDSKGYWQDKGATSESADWIPSDDSVTDRDFHNGDTVIFDVPGLEKDEEGNETGEAKKVTVKIVGKVQPSGTISVTVGEGSDLTFENAQTNDDDDAGSITGKVSLVKTGSGTLTIKTSNSYTGGTTLNGGTIIIYDDNALGSSSNTNITASNRSSIVTILEGTLDMNEQEMNNHVLIKPEDDDAEITIKHAYNFKRAMTIENGNVTIDGGLRLATSNSRALTLNGGTITLNGKLTGLAHTSNSSSTTYGKLVVQELNDKKVNATFNGDVVIGSISMKSGEVTITGNVTLNYSSNTFVMEGGTMAIKGNLALGTNSNSRKTLTMKGGTLMLGDCGDLTKPDPEESEPDDPDTPDGPGESGNSDGDLSSLAEESPDETTPDNVTFQGKAQISGEGTTFVVGKNVTLESDDITLKDSAVLKMVSGELNVDEKLTLTLTGKAQVVNADDEAIGINVAGGKLTLAGADITSVTMSEGTLSISGKQELEELTLSGGTLRLTRDNLLTVTKITIDDTNVAMDDKITISISGAELKAAADEAMGDEEKQKAVRYIASGNSLKEEEDNITIDADGARVRYWWEPEAGQDTETDVTDPDAGEAEDYKYGLWAELAAEELEWTSKNEGVWETGGVIGDESPWKTSGEEDNSFHTYDDVIFDDAGDVTIKGSVNPGSIVVKGETTFIAGDDNASIIGDASLTIEGNLTIQTQNDEYKGTITIQDAATLKVSGKEKDKDNKDSKDDQIGTLGKASIIVESGGKFLGGWIEHKEIEKDDPDTEPGDDTEPDLHTARAFTTDQSDGTEPPTTETEDIFHAGNFSNNSFVFKDGSSFTGIGEYKSIEFHGTVTAGTKEDGYSFTLAKDKMLTVGKSDFEKGVDNITYVSDNGFNFEDGSGILYDGNGTLSFRSNEVVFKEEEDKTAKVAIELTTNVEYGKTYTIIDFGDLPDAKSIFYEYIIEREVTVDPEEPTDPEPDPEAPDEDEKNDEWDENEEPEEEPEPETKIERKIVKEVLKDILSRFGLTFAKGTDWDMDQFATLYYENGKLMLKMDTPPTPEEIASTLTRNQRSAYWALRKIAGMGKSGTLGAYSKEVAMWRQPKVVQELVKKLDGSELASAMSSQIEGNMSHLRRLRAHIGSGQFVDPREGTLAAYVKLFSDNHKLKEDSSGLGHKRTVTGGTLGMETMIKPTMLAGVAVNDGRARITPTNSAGHNYEDVTRFDVYLAVNLGDGWQSVTTLGLGSHSFTYERVIDAEQKLRARIESMDGSSVNFSQEFSYTFSMTDTSAAKVYFSILSSINKIKAFKEEGAGTVSLAGDAREAWATDLGLGVRFTHAFTVMHDLPQAIFTVQTGVVASIGDTTADINMHFIGAPDVNFSITDAQPKRLGYQVGADVLVPVAPGASLSASAGAVLRGGNHEMSASVGMWFTF